VDVEKNRISKVKIEKADKTPPRPGRPEAEDRKPA
jgi:hypothetical protein